MKATIHATKAALLAAALSLAAVAPSVHAGEPSAGAERRAVHYSDLNLNTAAGAQVLYRRIRHAAEQVCGEVGSRQLEIAAAAKACVDRAIVSSVRAIDSAQLTRTAGLHGYAVDSRFTLAAAR